MAFALPDKGWTVIDSAAAPTLCGISLKWGPRGRGRPQVVAVAEQLAPDADAAGAGTVTRTEVEALRDLLGPLDRSLSPLVTLPRSAYRLRVLPEPAVLPREMSNTLRWSIRSEIDMTDEAFNLAWMAIPTAGPLPERARQVYAITTARPPLLARMALWRQAGLKPKVVDIRETALRNLASLLEQPNQGTALVSVDPEGAGMVFTHQGALFLDRYIEQPLAELGPAGSESRSRWHDRIAQQLQRSVDHIVRAYPFMPITRVVVAPEPQPLGLLAHLQAVLPLPVQGLQLAEHFDLDRVPALAQSPALQARCLVPLGAALRGARSLP